MEYEFIGGPLCGHVLKMDEPTSEFVHVADGYHAHYWLCEDHQGELFYAAGSADGRVVVEVAE